MSVVIFFVKIDWNKKNYDKVIYVKIIIIK